MPAAASEVSLRKPVTPGRRYLAEDNGCRSWATQPVGLAPAAPDRVTRWGFGRLREERLAREPERARRTAPAPVRGLAQRRVAERQRLTELVASSQGPATEKVRGSPPRRPDASAWGMETPGRSCHQDRTRRASPWQIRWG